MSHQSTGPIHRHIVDEAAHWLARMHSRSFTEQDQLAWEQWHSQSSEHQRVWHSAEQLAHKLGGIDPGLAMPVLNRPRKRDMRRATIKTMAIAMTLPAGAWLAIDGMRADTSTTYKTATGERRDLTLEDGSMLALNTGTTVEAIFTDKQRTLHQRSGEILVQTAPDPATMQRPFVVYTGDGRLQALGTRFIVRKAPTGTQLAVLEGAVEIHTAVSDERYIIHAGQQATFTPQAIGPVTDVAVGAGAWRDGVIYAQHMPLPEFVAELGRYRSGILRCDPSLNTLTVSGAFHIADTDRALKLLAATMPVKIAMRTRYWVSIEPQ